MLTNGQVVPGWAFTGVDVFLSSTLFRPLLYKPEKQALELFQQLVMHEVGHGIGLAHPTPFWNLDNDSDPSNPMPISPLDPAFGLSFQSTSDCRAMMQPRSDFCAAPGAALIDLQNDDIGGITALYPVPEPKASALAALAGIACIVFMRRRW